jgi:hypothetical protein
MTASPGSATSSATVPYDGARIRNLATRAAMTEAPRPRRPFALGRRRSPSPPGSVPDGLPRKPTARAQAWPARRRRRRSPSRGPGAKRSRRRRVRFARLLLLGKDQIRLRRIDVAFQHVDPLHADSGINPIARGACLTQLCVRQDQRRAQLRVQQLGEIVALAHALPRRHGKACQAPARAATTAMVCTRRPVLRGT